jgi:hypothetical protein
VLVRQQQVAIPMIREINTTLQRHNFSKLLANPMDVPNLRPISRGNAPEGRGRRDWIDAISFSGEIGGLLLDHGQHLL